MGTGTPPGAAEEPVAFAPLRTVASGRQRHVFVAMTVPAK